MRVGDGCTPLIRAVSGCVGAQGAHNESSVHEAHLRTVAIVYVEGRTSVCAKVLRRRPCVVATVSVTVYRALHPEREGPVRVGLQLERMGSSALFVVPDPGGRNANYSYAEMLAAFRALRPYVERAGAWSRTGREGRSEASKWRRPGWRRVGERAFPQWRRLDQPTRSALSMYTNQRRCPRNVPLTTGPPDSPPTNPLTDHRGTTVQAADASTEVPKCVF